MSHPLRLRENSTFRISYFSGGLPYGEFQEYLAINPLAGDVIQQTGGLRKVRWSAQGKGKRGGVRVIYYHVTADSQIRLILIYKNGYTG